MRGDRRDVNERAIVDFWKSIGCAWVPGKPGQGCDGFLLFRGILHIIEIKQPSERDHLTEFERELCVKAELRGIPYNIITTLEEAAKLIGIEVQE